jgi:hypothetical protein
MRVCVCVYLYECVFWYLFDMRLENIQVRVRVWVGLSVL